MPPAPSKEDRLSASDILDYGAGWEDPDAPTMLHRSARNPRAEDKPSIAPVSMRSEELIEADDNGLARNNRWARVGYAAVFAATLVAGLYVWRMQPQAAARSVVAASPQPFIKAPAQLLIATAQPVIERAADPVAITADAASQKASAQAAGATRNASVSKQRSSKTSKGEAASESPAAEEGAPAAAPESDPTHAAAAHQDDPAATAPAAAATAEQAPELPPFNQAAAQAALDAAAGRAAGCLKEGEPSGMARVVVTFAPSGRVTTASVDGPPYAGTPTGGCIARAFRSAEIAPFSGKLMTVGKTVTLR